METSNLIVQKTFVFSLSVMKYTDVLNEVRQFVIARQVMRSGTAIGANVWEAQHAESRLDFIHKLKIAAKEASETNYWLLLCAKADAYPNCDYLLKELEVIQKLLSKIIATTKQKLK